MAGIGVRGRAAALVVAAVTAAAGALAAASPSSADGPLTVVWPTITRFNPDTTSYVIEAMYAGPGYAFVFNDASRGTFDPLDPEGSHVVRFQDGWPGGWHRVTIVECPTPTFSFSCPTLAWSPGLEAYRGAVAGISDDGGFGPNDEIALRVGPSQESWDVAWQVVPAATPTGAPVTSGSASSVPSAGPLPPLGVQPQLVHGSRYLLRGTVTSNTDAFGLLEGTFEYGFTWDSEPPRFTLFVGHSSGDPDYVVVNDDVFYPAEDDYFDEAIIEATVQDYEIKRATVVVTDGAGEEVFRREITRDPQPHLSWDGRDPDHKLLPEGDYEVSLTAFDTNDNAASASRTIELSHARKYAELWRRTFRAAPTVLDKAVQGCGRLTKPARPAWRGSLGYHVRSPCNERTVVATTNGVYVPRSPIGEYRGMRVTVNGGKGLGESRADLLLFYLHRNGDWVARRRLDGEVGRHPGEWLLRSNGILGDEREQPHAVWSVGLSKGWKYDVRSFTVEVNWVDLR